MSKTADKAREGMMAGFHAGLKQAEQDKQRAVEATRARTITLLPIETIKLREQDTRPARAGQVLAIGREHRRRGPAATSRRGQGAPDRGRP
jgi:hypothetical protein